MMEIGIYRYFVHDMTNLAPLWILSPGSGAKKFTILEKGP